MKKKHKITFLLDENNNWIEGYIKKIFSIKNSKFYFKFVKDYKKIKNQNVVFIINYTKILPKSFLIQNDLNLVVHASNLPKGKGFAPIQWEILNNKNKFNICLIKAEEKVDSGGVIEENFFYLKGHELNTEIRKIQADQTIKIIKKFLKKYPKFKLTQQKGASTYFRRRQKKDSKLNVNKSLKSSFNLLRIVDNDKYPAFFEYKKKKYIIKIFKYDN